MTLPTKSLSNALEFESFWNFVFQTHFIEIAWRKPCADQTSSGQPSASAFEIEMQKKAFIQKLVEIIRKMERPSLVQSNDENAGNNQRAVK